MEGLGLTIYEKGFMHGFSESFSKSFTKSFLNDFDEMLLQKHTEEVLRLYTKTFTDCFVEIIDGYCNEGRDEGISIGEARAAAQYQARIAELEAQLAQVRC